MDLQLRQAGRLASALTQQQLMPSFHRYQTKGGLGRGIVGQYCSCATKWGQHRGRVEAFVWKKSPECLGNSKRHHRLKSGAFSSPLIPKGRWWAGWGVLPDCLPSVKRAPWACSCRACCHVSVGTRGRAWRTGRCRANRRCQGFSPCSLTSVGVIPGCTFSDEDARCVCELRSFQAVANCHWLFPRGCSAVQRSFLGATLQHLLPLCAGLQRSLLVSLSVASNCSFCFHLPFLFYQ